MLESKSTDRVSQMNQNLNPTHTQPGSEPRPDTAVGPEFSSEPAVLAPVLNTIRTHFPAMTLADTGIGSTIFAIKPGDGSAREQAASCQRVLGGLANLSFDYATKRYRSNLINWGMLPFLIENGDLPFQNLDYLYIPAIRQALTARHDHISAYVVRDGKLRAFTLRLGTLSDEERQIILRGCLINYNKPAFSHTIFTE